jgi:hypothetical protein
MLSFQRFERPTGDVFDCAPSSLGALPVGLSESQGLLLPLAADECFWIGLGLRAPRFPTIEIGLAAEFASGDVVDAISGMAWGAQRPAVVMVPVALRIEGIRRTDGRFKPFMRESSSVGSSCVCLRILVAGSVWREVLLRLVDYPFFVTETGLPPPGSLDRDAGYRGYRLP